MQENHTTLSGPERKLCRCTRPAFAKLVLDKDPEPIDLCMGCALRTLNIEANQTCGYIIGDGVCGKPATDFNIHTATHEPTPLCVAHWELRLEAVESLLHDLRSIFGVGGARNLTDEELSVAYRARLEVLAAAKS